MQMSSFLLYKVGNKRSNVRQMFNLKKTVVKPTPLKHPRKLVVNKVIPGEHASSSAAALQHLLPSKIFRLTMTAKVFPPRTGRNIPRAYGLLTESSGANGTTPSQRTSLRLNHRAVLLGKHRRRRSYILAALLPRLLARRCRRILSSSERTAAGVCAWPLKTRLICLSLRKCLRWTHLICDGSASRRIPSSSERMKTYE